MSILQQMNQKAVWFDVSDRDEITLTGKDRNAFLNGFCTNQVKDLPPGAGCEAFITTIKGRTLGHIFVFSHIDKLMLDTSAGAAAAIVPHLDRYLITEDVHIAQTDPARKLFLLTGSQAETLANQLTPKASSQAINGCEFFESNGFAGELRRIDWFPQPVFQLAVMLENEAACREWLEQQDVAAGTAEDFELARIDAGFPLHGRDFSDENLAQEVDRTQQAISFVKGCYLGQEPVARIDALGHVNRMLSRFVIQNEADLPVAQFVKGELQEPAAEKKKAVGGITSVAAVPETKEILALGWVRREYSEPGTELTVAVEGQSCPVTVSPVETE